MLFKENTKNTKRKFDLIDDNNENGIIKRIFFCIRLLIKSSTNYFSFYSHIDNNVKKFKPFDGNYSFAYLTIHIYGIINFK